MQGGVTLSQGDREQKQIVALLLQRLGHRGQHHSQVMGEEALRGAKVIRDECNGVRPIGPQTPGGAIGVIVELDDRLAHAIAHRRGGRAGSIVEHIRHDRGRNAGAVGHVANGGSFFVTHRLLA